MGFLFQHYNQHKKYKCTVKYSCHLSQNELECSLCTHGVLIMKCLAAISLLLWFVQRRAYTGNRDELVFLFLFIYSLFRVGPHKDLKLNTKMIVVWL